MVARRPAEKTGARPLARILRTVLIALLVAFVFGLVVGTKLRRQLERQERYIGLLDLESTGPSAHAGSSGGAIDPGDIGNTLTCVLVSRQHEEQIG